MNQGQAVYMDDHQYSAAQPAWQNSGYNPSQPQPTASGNGYDSNGVPYPYQMPLYTIAGSAPVNANPNLILPNQLVDPALATQIGLAYGGQAFSVGKQMFDQNVNRYINLPALKYYFAVSNEYVLNKLRLLVFPFAQKSWNRSIRSEAEFAPPREDVNAPDMYIPLMAFVTYTLLVGLALGQQNKFNPEILGVTLSKGVGVMVFEVLFIKFGAYLINLNADFQWLDLIAYTGYKFVSMIFTLAAFLLLGSYGFWTAFIYLSSALSFFILRSLRQSLVMGEATVTSQSPPRRRRNYFLLTIAASQVISSYFLLLF